MRSALWLAVVIVVLAGCSPSDNGGVATTATPSSGSAGGATTTTTPDPRSKEALAAAGHRLDMLAATRQDAQAWEFYSARCQAEIGSLTRYSAVLDEFFRGRTPKYESAALPYLPAGTASGSKGLMARK